MMHAFNLWQKILSGHPSDPPTRKSAKEQNLNGPAFLRIKSGKAEEILEDHMGHIAHLRGETKKHRERL